MKNIVTLKYVTYLFILNLESYMILGIQKIAYFTETSKITNICVMRFFKNISIYH